MTTQFSANRSYEEILAHMAKVKGALSKSEPRGITELSARTKLDRVIVADSIERLAGPDSDCKVLKHGDKRGARYSLG